MDSIIPLHTPTLDDRAWVSEVLDGIDFMNCEYCFGNMFLWAEAFGTMIGKWNDFLLLRSGTAYLFPIGRGEVTRAVEYLIGYADARGEALKFLNVTGPVRELLERNFPDRFEFVENRAFADYIYSVDDLINLSGKKYHKKRNHLSNFKKRYNYTFEQITSANLYECFEMYEVWLKNKNAENDENYDEYSAIKRAFDNFEKLGFVGGALRVDGKIEASDRKSVV